MIALHDPRPAGYVMVSGVFDITPIVHTPINDDVRMSPADAERLSPINSLVPRPGVACIASWGQQETSEFRRQSLEWVHRWSEIPRNGPSSAIEASGRHHFDIVYDLVDTSTDLRWQALRESIDRIDAVLYTHAHHVKYGHFNEMKRTGYEVGLITTLALPLMLR